MNATMKLVLLVAGFAISLSQVSAAEEIIQIKKRGSVRAHGAKISGLAFSPSGDLLASTSDDRTMKLWKVMEGTLESVSAQGTRGLNSVAFSPDGKMLFIGGGSGSKTLDFFDVASRKNVRSVNTAHYVYNVTVSPDGRRVATGAYIDKYLKVWDVETGASVKILATPALPEPHAKKSDNRPMGFTAFSPDGKYFAGCAASSPYPAVPTIWDAKTLEIKSRFVAHDNRCYSIIFSPDSKTLAIGTQDGTLKLWDVAAAVKAWSDRAKSKATAEEIALLIRQLNDDSFEVRETASSKLTEIGAAATGLLKEALESTDVPEVRFRVKKILQTASDVGAEPLVTLKPEAVLSETQTGGVRALAFSGDGRLLAAGCWKFNTKMGQLTVWDIEQPDEPVLNLDTRGIEALVFSRDGKTLMTGMRDGTITLWDVMIRE